MKNPKVPPRSDLRDSSGTDAGTGVKTMTSDISDVNTVEEFACRIPAALRKSIEGIMEVAALCARAERILTLDQRKALRTKLKMDAGYFSKMSSIANNAYLNTRANWDRLPASYTTLYVLSGMSPERLETISPRLRPDMQRKDAEKLADKKGRSPAAGAARTLFCVVIGDAKLDPSERAILERVRDELNECSAVEVVDTGVYDSLLE